MPKAPKQAQPEPKPAELPPQSPPGGTKKRRKGKITVDDANRIAELVGDQKLTETEACIKLGFTPRTWYNWKARRQHNGQFDEVVSRVRANKIVMCMDGIKAAGARDWRALYQLLVIADRERFGDRQSGPAVQVQVFSEDAIQRGLRSVYGQPALVVSEPPKQLSDTQPVAVSK